MASYTPLGAFPGFLCFASFDFDEGKGSGFFVCNRSYLESRPPFANGKFSLPPDDASELDDNQRKMRYSMDVVETGRFVAFFARVDAKLDAAEVQFAAAKMNALLETGLTYNALVHLYEPWILAGHQPKKRSGEWQKGDMHRELIMLITKPRARPSTRPPTAVEVVQIDSDTADETPTEEVTIIIFRQLPGSEFSVDGKPKNHWFLLIKTNGFWPYHQLKNRPMQIISRD